MRGVRYIPEPAILRRRGKSMVDNQHRQIAGYRELSPEDITLMNEIKTRERDLMRLIDIVLKVPGANQRSVALARTNLQTGFMWLVRAIARPNDE
jgi:hypothetical protein